eukprot:XP_002257555.1 hypothetical protein, conserved in Plasmodium species [Plasmodium knowlesi strain H]
MNVLSYLLWLVIYSILLLSLSLAFIRKSHSVVTNFSLLKRAQGGNCYHLISSYAKRRKSLQLLPPNGDKDRCVRRYHILYSPDERGGDHHHGGGHGHGGKSEFVQSFNKRNCFLKPAIFAKRQQHKLWAHGGDSLKQVVQHATEEGVKGAGTNREKPPHEEVESTHWDDQFDLISNHILVSKNRKSIKDLMEAGIWGTPKENIKMIRERTNKKINWNYILKKNNKLLNDNVDHIYKEIYNKENVDDIFFVFDTNPYNYLNITMSVFSLYKITASYLNERRQRVGSSLKGKKVDVLSLDEPSKGALNVVRPNDNFFTMDGGGEDTYGEVDDRNILKMKEERKRLNYIVRNRNFMRIIGSINKHLKIIYKIFSTNEKLTRYEKNKDMYKYIPYINIKDIITILRCFSILKLEHTNIFKYIYFFLVFFMDEFDMFLLCEAVYLCLVKKIYVRPLFLNFSKHLLRYLRRGDKGCAEGGSTEPVGDVTKDGSNDAAIGIGGDQAALYNEVNLETFCRNMEQALRRKDPEPDHFASSPFHMKHFTYSIYHDANYSSLNSSQDELLKEKARISDDMKNKYSAQDLRHAKKEFIDSDQVQTKSSEPTKVKSPPVVDTGRICFPVYCVYTLCKFPYTNVQILNMIISEIMEKASELSIEELILSFYSLAELEVDDRKFLNVLFLRIFKCLHFLDYRNSGLVTKLIRALYLVDGDISAPPGEEKRYQQVKTLMIHYLSKMVLHNRNNYTPIELVDIIRYMSAFSYIDKEFFNFVYEMPFLQNLNQDALDYYKNNIYFNQSYYAYTKDSSVNTPIEIMVCKLYQSYLAYRAWGMKTPQMDDLPALESIRSNNDKVNPFKYGPKLLELFKQTYTNNMRISSYSSSSLHYEIVDIIKKDLKIPCHVEYVTDKGLFIDIVILRKDLIKLDTSFSRLRDIAIEVNGPFHYKTKSYNGGVPPLNTKTVVKQR